MWLPYFELTVEALLVTTAGLENNVFASFSSGEAQENLKTKCKTGF